MTRDDCTGQSAKLFVSSYCTHGGRHRLAIHAPELYPRRDGRLLLVMQTSATRPDSSSATWYRCSPSNR